MPTRFFEQLLQERWNEGKCVCVGLDSELEKIPSEAKSTAEHMRKSDQLFFNAAIVDETADLVLAYKPNVAFYAANGTNGIEALRASIGYIQAVAPDVPVILDAKVADIGSTNEGYVKFAFDYLGADAITVHPYLGQEALKPFLERDDKGIIVLCRTSNPGAGEFQDLAAEVSGTADLLFGERKVGSVGVAQPFPLYQIIAHRVASEWNGHGNCAVVVGATYPEELAEVRKIVGDMPILIPGIGAQGGEVEKTVTAGRDNNRRGMIINSSRGIIFASSGPDFAGAARSATQKLHDEITQVLVTLPPRCDECGSEMKQIDQGEQRTGWVCNGCGTYKVSG